MMFVGLTPWADLVGRKKGEVQMSQGIPKKLMDNVHAFARDYWSIVESLPKRTWFRRVPEAPVSDFWELIEQYLLWRKTKGVREDREWERADGSFALADTLRKVVTEGEAIALLECAKESRKPINQITQEEYLSYCRVHGRVPAWGDLFEDALHRMTTESYWFYEGWLKQQAQKWQLLDCKEYERTALAKGRVPYSLVDRGRYDQMMQEPIKRMALNAFERWAREAGIPRKLEPRPRIVLLPRMVKDYSPEDMSDANKRYGQFEKWCMRQPSYIMDEASFSRALDLRRNPCKWEKCPECSGRGTKEYAVWGSRPVYTESSYVAGYTRKLVDRVVDDNGIVHFKEEFTPELKIKCTPTGETEQVVTHRAEGTCFTCNGAGEGWVEQREFHPAWIISVRDPAENRIAASPAESTT